MREVGVDISAHRSKSVDTFGGQSFDLVITLGLSYEDAAPSAMIGASNHFEVAIATSTMLFGLSSGAALATVVGVLIEVPVMLMLVRICLRTESWFRVPLLNCCDDNRLGGTSRNPFPFSLKLRV
jgi:hypothetical protein